jgi:hypothetical protein
VVFEVSAGVVNVAEVDTGLPPVEVVYHAYELPPEAVSVAVLPQVTLVLPETVGPAKLFTVTVTGVSKLIQDEPEEQRLVTACEEGGVEPWVLAYINAPEPPAPPYTL